MRRSITVLAIMLLATCSAWAGTLAGVTMPDQITVSGKTLQLNGMGLRTKVFFKIYVAGLYLEEKSADPAQVVSSVQLKRVVMHFLSGKATKSRMDDAWREGFEKNSPQEYEALKPRIEQLVGYFGDMKPGDEIVFTFEPDKGTVVSLSGQEKGTIPGEDFAAALLRVWLGSEPPTADLKKGMLGG